MIKVTVGQNLMKKVFNDIDESTMTLRSVLEKAGMNTAATFHLDGDVVTADMMDKTFAANGVYENCYLVSVTKADSASRFRAA